MVLYGDSEEKLKMMIRLSARNMAHNLAVKIDAISGRETNAWKLGNTASQPTPEADFDPSVYIGIDCA